MLAFGVFGVQYLVIDREVAETAPTFASGAAVEDPSTAPTTVDTPVTPVEVAPDAAPTTVAPPTVLPPTTPTVGVVGSGSFTDGAHPGSGTATVLSDGLQSFVRLEDDFATDNGPDLRAVAIVGGQRVDLGELKGNVGSQNYELPAEVTADSVERVEVWCRRFDVTFTSAELS